MQNRNHNLSSSQIGFCNCTDGVTADADLDRLADFELFGGMLYAQAPGEPVKAAWMAGRLRPFAVRGATLLTVGLHDRCDALVASAVLPRGALQVAEPAVRRFLASRQFAEWASATLGL